MQNEPGQDLHGDDFSDYRVLLVEDDEIMRLSLEDRLRLENIPVQAVADLSGARKELEKGEIDLVVTDIRLPDGTGIELFSDISNRFPGIPVILMTAFGDISDAVTREAVIPMTQAEIDAVVEHGHVRLRAQELL